MSSLALLNYSTHVDKMKKESGDSSCPIWLLVNPKYPNDICDIWTPVMYEIQDKVFHKLNTRIDSANIYILNAVSNIGRVPDTSNYGLTEVAEEIVTLRKSVLEHQPKILITFGTITNELVRRVIDNRPEKGPKYWNTSNIGNEFERSIANFDINRTNWIPLVRGVTKSGRVIKDWEDSGNFYRDMASKIADRIIENKDALKIWI